MIGCGPSSYQLGSEPWPAGDYEVAIAYVQSGSNEVECSFRVGADSMSGDDDAGAFENEPMADCSTTMSGAIEMWAATDGVTLSMYDSPASFELTVKREEQVLFDETITPDYKTMEINGPGCGVCRNTNATIDVGDL